ncbi:MFS transporter [Actinoplanes sp. HUAS TT8]|uniref:MFS transporter n=1 Tax=Actinoplanes sp. HUAS TT8 TaxID=3447453 RepID=UPI003F523F57
MRRAPALSFLLITVFIDMLGLGLVVPILPALLTSVTANAALWSGLLGTVFGLLQFVAAPLLGRLSDRYGRRPVLLVSLGVLGVDWLAHAVTSGPWPLLIVHALAGACAGTNTVVNAYIGDVCRPEERSRAYGMIGSAFGLGFVAGPLIGGLLGAVDVRLPFLVAAGLSFANVTYGWLILPESRPGDGTTPLSLRLANPFTAIATLFRRAGLGRLAHARLHADLARMIHQSTWAFFLTYRFAWGTAHVGAVIAAGAVAIAVFQARAVGPVVRRLGEKPAALVGTMIGAIAFLGTAFVTVAWALYALQVLAVVSSVGATAASGWISRSIGADEQGTVQGALTSLSAVAEMVVPLAAGAAFTWALTHGSPGLVYLGSAAFTVASALLLATAGPGSPRDRSPAPTGSSRS